MRQLFRHSLLTLVIATLGTTAGAQTSAFTYQGNLTVGGVPANGGHDFQFFLFSAASGGSPVGLGVGVNNVVVTNGNFNVIVSFPNQFTGPERWLEIRVRPAGQGSFTTLAPRQIVTSAPYSVKSLNSELLGGLPASQYVLTVDPRLSDARNPLPNSANYIQNRTTQQPTSSFNVSGNGTIGGSLSVVEASTFQKSMTVGTTLSVGEGATFGGGLNVGGPLTVTSPANVTGSINTGGQFNISGNLALGRSRLDLFNTLAIPRGFSFEVLNSPSFLVLRNDLGTTIMTVTADGKVGIGASNPTEATLEIGGTLAVSNLGGSNGEHLCRDGNVIRACSVATANASNETDISLTKIAALESRVGRQQLEIERQRTELAALKNFICSQNAAAEFCGPKQR
ncbi:MAG TPA: hypothetical protein VJV05_08170 [Pyrinomonadaceae bacterium]|nr:hypothetical protein [Pyrinomonadaceae bacterium]